MKKLRVLFGVLLILSVLLISYLVRYNLQHSPQVYKITEGLRQYEISLSKNGDADYSVISHDLSAKERHKVSEWKLPYPVFHFECARIDEDSTDDILVGVVKATKFDTVLRKRIFIFKLVDGSIRPLWLGSRVSQPLEDFKVIPSANINVIRTIEYEANGNYLVAEYKWRGFGLEFVRYLVRNKTLAGANKLLSCINCEK